jgi:sporulation protein YlmC with PRC-barrel domain
MASRQPAVLSSSTLVGDSVVNRDGEELGHLKDLMIDLDHGQIAYGVLSRGGFASVGEELFAIPWTLFEVDADAEELILGLSEETLDDSPGFDPEHWPSFSERGWASQLHDHYRLVPYWE